MFSGKRRQEVEWENYLLSIRYSLTSKVVAAGDNGMRRPHNEIETTTQCTDVPRCVLSAGWDGDDLRGRRAVVARSSRGRLRSRKTPLRSVLRSHPSPLLRATATSVIVVAPCAETLPPLRRKFRAITQGEGGAFRPSS
jgi:hypothetical protein